MRARRTLNFAAVLLAAACSPESPPEQSSVPPAQQPTIWVYDCGDDYKFTAQFRETEVLLDLPDQSLTLPQAVSGSGARYSNGTVTFWDKGGEGLIEGAGPTHTGCKSQSAQNPWDAARLLGASYRALGQEPGWMLQIEPGRRILFIGDYGEIRVSAPVPTPQIDPGISLHYVAQTESAVLDVRIEMKPCSDTMSGDPFPDTVTVMFNGREYRGCGRSLE